MKLSGPVTDLDLSDDGTRAIAVVRDPGSDTPLADAGSDVSATARAAGRRAPTRAPTPAPRARRAPAAPRAPRAAGRRDGQRRRGGHRRRGGRDRLRRRSGRRRCRGGPGRSRPTRLRPDRPSNSDVALLPIPGIFSAPTVFDTVTISGETVGSVSVSASGGVALLYTNAFANDHLTILTTAPGTGYLEHRTVALKAPVKSVFPTPTTAHTPSPCSIPSAGSSKAGAFSVVPVLANLPPKILGTDAPPMGVAIEPRRAAAPWSR